MGAIITARCDTRGRVYLRDELRKRHGESFIVTESESAIKLLPVPEDAAADLADLGRGLPDESIAELKARIRDRARREAV